jgi:hypothetical protein
MGARTHRITRDPSKEFQRNVLDKLPIKQYVNNVNRTDITIRVKVARDTPQQMIDEVISPYNHHTGAYMVEIRRA